MDRTEMSIPMDPFVYILSKPIKGLTTHSQSLLSHFLTAARCLIVSYWKNTILSEKVRYKTENSICVQAEGANSETKKQSRIFSRRIWSDLFIYLMSLFVIQ